MASVLITGASKGIGRATAVEFARRGHRVVATARDPRALDALDVDQRLPLDVVDTESIAAAVWNAGEIDILVSNAGLIFGAVVEAIPVEKLAELFDVNTLGSLRVAQAVLPSMRARGNGRLLFMSSVLGRIVMSPGAAYQATKWALEALVEALAIEVAPFGLEAALLEPGRVSTGHPTPGFALPNDPYHTFDRLQVDGGVPQGITPAEAAIEVADAAEASLLPLRIPIGDEARAILAARREAPDTVPFIPGAPAEHVGAKA